MEPMDSRANRGPLTSLSFRAFLRDELARRCAGNPQYSLRAFAMHLEMDHSTLSQVMRGKRAVTERMIRGLGARLRLVEDEMTAFIRYEAVCATERVGAMTVVRQLVHDAASLISDPLHYDILELTRVESFQPDSRWIARVLDTTPDEVNIAVTRLVRLGLMEMVEKNRWVDTSGPETQTRAGFARLVIRRLVERTDESAPDEE